MIDKIYAAPKFIDLEEGIDFALERNIGYEIPTFICPNVLEDSDGEIKKYKKLLKNLDGSLALHGPVIDTNPVSLDESIAKESQKRYTQAAQASLSLNVKYIVFHSQYSPVYEVAHIYDQWMEKNIAYWSEFIEKHLEGTDMVILMENFMDPSPKTLKDLAAGVNSPHFKLCLDTGHVNLFSKIHPIHWLDELAPYLAYIHAHNNFGEKDDHYGFNKGNIDMAGFLNHLALLPNRMSIALEVFDMEGIAESYEMLQPYLKMQEEQTAKSFLI